MPKQNRRKPTYDLATIKDLLDAPNTRIVTRQAYWTAVSYGYAGEDEVVDTVKKISLNDFYKTMEAERCPGLWQDVYHLEDRGRRLYIKLQLSADRKAVIIQFKEK